MLKNLLLFFGSSLLASLILIISILRVSQVQAFSQDLPTPSPVKSTNLTIVSNLPYPGHILPDSPFWPMIALRDKVWSLLTINPAQKANLNLALANKRLAAAVVLFEEGKSNLGFSVLSKAENYLSESNREEYLASQEGSDMKDFLQKYTLSTIEHAKVINSLATVAPENVKPLIIKIENSPNTLYGFGRDNLNEVHLPVPQNPYLLN
ncbi:MAG TPA: DUF5667 domain-containing protein [Patescibacteria group bacterium]|nr:DUF5667 domain-containing protein [Patescibacteria group bacterium]